MENITDQTLIEAKRIYHKMLYENQKKRLQNDTEFYEKMKLYRKSYNKKQYQTNPEQCEKQKERARNYYQQNKERIKEEKRIKYNESKKKKSLE